MVRLQQYYRDTVVPKLKADLKIDNPMQIPKIIKITVNMGVGEAVADKKVMDAAVADLTKITGQKPLITKSRKAIASFKIREGLAIGCKVTLRGARMYEFLDRLISIAMPRIRDFRGDGLRNLLWLIGLPWRGSGSRKQLHRTVVLPISGSRTLAASMKTSIVVPSLNKEISPTSPPSESSQ
jgi:hypothetical protein